MNVRVLSVPPDLIQYQLTSTGDGYLLTIWEDAAVSETRLKPFLFKIHHTVESQDEAEQILQHYLKAYRH